MTTSARQIIMDSIINRPVLIYDDRCSSCTIFAKFAFKCSRGYLDCTGHYSKDGERFREIMFPPNFNETEMFWIITSKHAYGGRSALLPLLGLIIKGLIMTSFNHEFSRNRIFPGYCSDSAMCNNKRFKVKRLFNLIRRGKRINVRFVNMVKD